MLKISDKLPLVGLCKQTWHSLQLAHFIRNLAKNGNKYVSLLSALFLHIGSKHKFTFMSVHVATYEKPLGRVVPCSRVEQTAQSKENEPYKCKCSLFVEPCSCSIPSPKKHAVPVFTVSTVRSKGRIALS